ncbi:uncharacterized protein BO97DRAFT_423767 [Aspergillus homomorphus CBS 101889]|uniref:Uncharacterized protein n=1 Tax=Aspergillus homomorphus (strain CBS 101889) TaxID=1450537 RepID=A0A395HZ37_ASPHC|nr:hypothetical protein BO97DRAFT_423767 [Aspergillus homomorphus CBS 101889]RAL13060.1 hypothetical protein BO97DRAFT_423767 [Aspergillus homomorphus CBS 101889]
MQVWTPGNDYTERLHVGAAYQAAVKLYLSRMLPDVSAGICSQEGQTRLVQVIINHVSQVPPSSALFKSAIWSSFVAGAETTNPRHRDWVATRLDTVSAQLPW